jgi:hypothetical protein
MTPNWNLAHTTHGNLTLDSLRVLYTHVLLSPPAVVATVHGGEELGDFVRLSRTREEREEKGKNQSTGK